MQKYRSTVFFVATIFLFCTAAYAQQAPPSAETESNPASGKEAATPATKAGAERPSTTSQAAGQSPGQSATGTAQPGTDQGLTTDEQRNGYALGLDIGKNIKQLDLDLASLLRGIQDAATGATPALSDAEVEAAVKAIQAQAQQRRNEEVRKAGEANMKEGEEFLAANKTKEGVVTTASGLQYKILTAGTGAKPTAADTVVCNYKGTLINGTEFDSSYKRGRTAEFPVGGVIKGWTEALQLMPVGSKWQLFVPSDLAYGARGAGGVIGPNQTLIFEVELISIKGQ